MQEIKYGVGVVTITQDDGRQIKVTVETRKGGDVTRPWKPYPIKKVAQLAEALQ
jgi:hypothetical protein